MDTPSEPNKPASPAVFWACLCLGIYLLICGLSALIFFLDTWLERNYFARLLFEPSEIETHAKNIALMSYVLSGAVMGAVIRSFRGLHIYGAIKGEFKLSFAGSYLIGPWVALLLGVSMYCLIRGGIVIFGGSITDESFGPIDLSYFTVGFVSGFAWERVLGKIDSVFGEMLSHKL